MVCFKVVYFNTEGKSERDKRRKKQREPVEMENERMKKMKGAEYI